MRSFRTGVNTQFAYAIRIESLKANATATYPMASYLVDRGVTEHWHPFGSMLVLYCEDLGTAFHEAAVAEIESRRIALKKNAAAGNERERMRCLLAQLKEDLSAG
jgi:hypothetical protein